MAKSKFYVVWDGRETGVFTSWNKCKASVDNYAGAKYKSFLTIEMASKAFKSNYFDFVGKKVTETILTKEELAIIGKPDLKSIAVDAACSGNPGVMEYRGVSSLSGKELFKMGPYPNGTNNVGEFLALVHGLAYLQKHDLDLKIYSDSQIAISWVKLKKCKTKLEINQHNKDWIVIVERAENWLCQNAYKNKILKWETKAWGEIPADFGRK
jgi:ribonuclease HI